MPLQFTTTGKQSNDGVKCGIYGRDGAGKTTLIPTSSRPFIIDVEGKTASIASENVPGVRVRTWPEWVEVKEWLKSSADVRHFDSLHVDSISKLGEISLLFQKQNNKDARRAYQEHRDWFSVALTTLLSLPQKHVCLMAWSTMLEQPDGTKIYGPSLPGMTAEQALGYSLNHLFFLNLGSYVHPTEPVNKDGQPNIVQYRYLQTEQDVYAQARDNSRTLLAKEPAHLGRMFAKIQAGVVISPIQ